MKNCENYIDGKFIPIGSRKDISVINPATEAVIGKIYESTPEDVDAAVQVAAKAQKSWGKLPAIERARHLRAIAQKIRENAEPLARLITEEQGKTLGLSRVEVSFTADYLDYMAEWARRIEGEIVTSDRPNETILLFRKPIGVIAGVLPWNFPFFLIARKLAPALVTGNTIVIKPSEETPLNAYEFAKLVAQTDLPAGVCNFVFGTGATTGSSLTSHRGVGMISFTGSVKTGSRIMAAAAENITKVNLELGGKAPAIIMADANIDLAVRAVVDSRVINSGQVCNCAERIYVDRRIAAEFTDKLSKGMAATKFGDPIKDETVAYGPLINKLGLDKVSGLVGRAITAGAQLVTGGKVADRSAGFYYEPTVLTGCKQDMEIIQNEIFGPVIPVVEFGDLDEAITFANDSEYGLTSSIFTNNLHIAMKAARELQFGETYINREHFEAMQGFHAGWRKSGIGGADGKHGLYEYTQTQAVYLQHDPTVK